MSWIQSAGFNELDSMSWIQSAGFKGWIQELVDSRAGGFKSWWIQELVVPRAEYKSWVQELETNTREYYFTSLWSAVDSSEV